MGVLDFFLEIPRSVHGVMCCSATRGKEEAPPLLKRTTTKDGRRPSSGAYASHSPIKSAMCGVGVVFQNKHEDGLYVSSLIKGGSAFQSNQIEVGDILMEVDGTDVSRMKVTDLGPFLLGEPGSKVRLLFRRKDEHAAVELTRSPAFSKEVDNNLSSKIDGKVVVGSVKKNKSAGRLSPGSTASID